MNALLLQSKAQTWAFPVDRGIRRRFFAESSWQHPAKLHLGLLQKLIDLYTQPGDTILDPMAGSGSLMLAATQHRNVILRDLQPEYVGLMLDSLPIIYRRGGLFLGRIDIGQADARTLGCPPEDLPPFDHIITSPPYGFETGNGISNYRRAELLAGRTYSKTWARYIASAKQSSIASGFRYSGGQANAGNKSGRNYWRDMEAIYTRCAELLPIGGLMILILKDHYRRGQLIEVGAQTVELVESLSLQLVGQHARRITVFSLWQRRRHEQGKPVVDTEDVFVFRKDALS